MTPVGSWGAALGLALLWVGGCTDEGTVPGPPGGPGVPGAPSDSDADPEVLPGEADTLPGDPDTLPGDPDTDTSPGDPLGTPGSYITELAVDPDPNAGPDLDGDGLGNNALGAMFTEIAALIPEASFNQEIAKGIDAGILSLGYLWPGLDPATLPGPPTVGLHLVDLIDPDGDPATVDAFSVAASAPGTTPGTPFANVSVIQGQVAGGPNDLPFDLPYFGVPLNLHLTAARISGTVTQDALGIAITNGTFTGVVDMKSVLVWANAFVASPACDCLVGEGPLLDPEAGFDIDACLTTPDTSACTSETAVARLCTFFAESCAIVAPVLGVHADIDSDGDGKPDSHSAVLHFEATGTAVEIP